MQPSLVSASQKPTVANTFDYNLEALRGLAALLVVLGHVLTNNFHLDPVFRIQGIWQYTPPGHLSVIVFFMLSGYVIGLTNKTPIKTNEQRWVYLKKRFVRLYPLYFLAILLAIVVAVFLDQSYSVARIGTHLIFGQVAFTQVLSTNEPLWSLSFEVAYYLFFLVLSAYTWKPSVAVLAFVAVGVTARFTPGMPSVVSSYCFGASFWLLGLCMAQFQRRTEPASFGVLLALLFLLLSYERMNLFQSFLAHTPLDFTEQETPSFFQRPIQFSDFSYLLFCVPLLLRFTNRQIPGGVWLERVAFLTPALYLAGYVFTGKINEQQLFDTLAGAIVWYVVAVSIYVRSSQCEAIGKWALERLAPLGAISYGLYVIHFPFILLFQQVNFLSGSTGTFLVRLSLFLPLMVMLGWFLERMVQPWIRHRLT